MVLVQELLQMVRVGAGDFGVEVGDVGYQVNEVVELPDVVARDGRGRRDEDLPLRIVCEPLVEEFLGVGSGRSFSSATDAKLQFGWWGQTWGLS
jgi:hypothetical protein